MALATLAMVGCGGDKSNSLRDAASIASSTTATNPAIASSSSPPVTPPTRPLDGTWTLAAPPRACEFDFTLDAATLTVDGSDATVEAAFGRFAGTAEPTGSGSGIRITADLAVASSSPPPHLDLAVSLDADTISGTSKFSGVYPSGQTGYVCDSTFTGRRKPAAGAVDLSAGPPYDTGGAAGSGCTPGNVASLPDGWWAGLAAHISGTTIDFDLVCYFANDAANVAAAEDGKPTPVDDDVYVRNSNPRTFSERFASRDLAATCTDFGASHFPCTVGELLDIYAQPGNPPFEIRGHETAPFLLWLHVSHGEPDSLFQQFSP